MAYLVGTAHSVGNNAAVPMTALINTPSGTSITLPTPAETEQFKLPVLDIIK